MITMFGKTEVEILAALEYYDKCGPRKATAGFIKQESKMTREEAYKKCFLSSVNYEGKDIDGFLKMLEALSLIKFEEKITQLKYVTIEHCGVNSNGTVTASVADMIEALSRIDILCVKKS